MDSGDYEVSAGSSAVTNVLLWRGHVHVDHGGGAARGGLGYWGNTLTN